MNSKNKENLSETKKMSESKENKGMQNKGTKKRKINADSVSVKM